MDALYDFLNWAWARHHNPLSWYIRPLFVLPFCYFAYKKSVWGVVLTIVAVATSMFWFPAPAIEDSRAGAFLAMERQYITGTWTLAKIAMTTLVPIWFFVLAWAFWRRSWLAGFLVINVGALLKVIRSFYFAGTSAWSIIPAVSLGALVINGVMLYAYWRVRRPAGTMLTVEDVFGKAGVIFQGSVDSIIAEAVNTTYTFLPIPQFQSLVLHRMSQVYWQEMLYRVHWAATSNLLRHQRWFECCRVLSVERPNFLGFCASLRGLVEGAADASYSLGAIPETLATHYSGICTALRGNATNLSVSAELEDMLIHFQFARRLQQKEVAPETHRAEMAARYISAIDTQTNPVRPMYEELCQVTHPAAHSLHWMTQNIDDQWSVTRGDDSETIRNLCRRHSAAIEWVQMQSVNLSIFLLQVLNVFPLQSLHTNVVLNFDMSSMRLWAKIKIALERQGVPWGA